MKRNCNVITLLKLCVDEDLHDFTVSLIVPLNSLLPCSLLTVCSDLPGSVVLCCKLILRSCKTLCTQKFLEPAKFRSIILSEAPWSKDLGVCLPRQLMSSSWCCRCYNYTSQMHVRSNFIGGLCCWADLDRQERNQCRAAMQKPEWSLVQAHQDSRTLEGKSSVDFHQWEPCSVQTREVVWGIA